MTQSTDHFPNDYRLSLITFEQDTVNIKTWWLTEDKFTLLSAALGDPEVDSIYPREYINDSQAAVMEQGVHVIKEDDDA